MQIKPVPAKFGEVTAVVREPEATARGVFRVVQEFTKLLQPTGHVAGECTLPVTARAGPNGERLDGIPDMGWEGDGMYHEFNEKTYQRGHRRDREPLSQMATAIPFPAAVSSGQQWGGLSQVPAAVASRSTSGQPQPNSNPSNSPRFFHPMSVSGSAAV